MPAREQSEPSADERVCAHRLLEFLFAALPSDDLEILLLSRLDGMKQDEIAEVMGLRSGGGREVRRRLKYADDALRRLFPPE